MYKIVLILFFSISLYAQQDVGINTTSPQSTLDITKNRNVPNTQPQGVIFPKMTTEQRNRMQAPIPPGLMIYNTTTKVINLYNGSVWVDFTGTPIENAIINRSNNIDTATEGRVGINTSSPQATLDIARDINAPQNQIQGVLFPSLTIEKRDRMQLPLPTGLMIYNTDKKAIELYNGNNWVILLNGGNDQNDETIISKEEEPVNYSNSKYWIYGVNVPVYPDDESKVPVVSYGDGWKDRGYWVKDDEGVAEIRWTEGMEWSDVNKKSLKKTGNQYHDDINLCWAATASNMLLWWTKNNKEFIERYQIKYPNKNNSILKDEYSASQYSEIFRFYRDTFRDVGSWATNGVDWFINGIKRELPAYRDYKKMEGFEGFFPRVFKNKKLTKDSNRWPKKEEFNKMLKEAFEQKKALAFAVYIRGYGNHAMTIWGAEFDEDGYASYIYFSDNNIFNEGEDKVGVCRRRKIVYDDEGKTYYVTKNNPKYKNLIISLMSLDLGTDLWKKAFN